MYRLSLLTLCFLFFGDACFGLDVEVAKKTPEREARRLMIEVSLSRILERELKNANSARDELKNVDELKLSLFLCATDYFQPYLKGGGRRFKEKKRDQETSFVY